MKNMNSLDKNCATYAEKILEKIREFATCRTIGASRYLNEVKKNLIYLKKIKHNVNDEKKYEIAKFLGEQYYYIDRTEDSIKYFQKALDLTKHPNQKAYCLLFIGKNLCDKSKYEQAIILFENGLKMIKEMEIKLEFFSRLSSTYFELKNYYRAITFARKLIKEEKILRLKNNNEKLNLMVQIAYLTLLKTYWQLNEESKYKNLFRKLLARTKSSKWFLEQVYIINGHKLYSKGKYNEAKNNYRKGISFAERKEDMIYLKRLISKIRMKNLLPVQNKKMK